MRNILRTESVNAAGPSYFIGFVLVLALVRAEPVYADRVALVIGNAAYVEASALLTNPVRDARAMALTLDDLDFEVSVAEDADVEEMEEAVLEFIGRVRPGDTAVFYYSGHGIELDGENYLLPVDFSSSYTPVRARSRSTSATEVLALMEEAGAEVRLVILDACRDNPFQATKTFSRGGLAAMAPRGGLVAFAAEAGGRASDNPGGTNGLYTQHLLAALEQPGVPANVMFSQVQRAVREASAGQQVPTYYDAGAGDFVFRADPVGGDLAFGTPAAGMLTRAGEDQWTFRGRAGTAVTVELTSEEFDTYVELFGPSGELAAEDDDGGGGTDSTIRDHALDASGDYTVVARGYDDAEEGRYSLLLSRGVADVVARPATALTLVPLPDVGAGCGYCEVDGPRECRGCFARTPQGRVFELGYEIRDSDTLLRLDDQEFEIWSYTVTTAGEGSLPHGVEVVEAAGSEVLQIDDPGGSGSLGASYLCVSIQEEEFDMVGGTEYESCVSMLQGSGLGALGYWQAQNCAVKWSGAACWMEVLGRRGCHVWNGDYQPGSTVTWTGQCRGRFAEGTGTLTWVAGASRRMETVRLEGGRGEGRMEALADVADVVPPTDVAQLDVARLRQIAGQGDAPAQTELGERYEDGRGVAQDYGEAVRWYRRAAEQGYVLGQYNLGVMYDTGRGVAQDDGEAVTWYRRAAEQGYSIGQFNLGFMYSTGRGVAQDYGEAVRWYRRAAEQGYVLGQYNLGVMYDTGRGVAQDDGEAVTWYRRAAEQGHSIGQFNLGFMYSTGRGVAQDYGEAVRWYRRAAEQGYSIGQFNLGFMYSNGRGVRQDYGEAVRWYRRAAEQGYSIGQTSLGVMYQTGRGVAQDDGEAVTWYRRAAEQGYVLGQYNLGLMYETGRGVRQDDGEAVRWYRRAAEQGHSIGQTSLGVMYQTGRGVAQDDGEAVTWYRRAAEQGYSIGQYNLGLMYETGRGVRQDRQEAVRWFRLAADQGHAGAQRNLDRLR